MHSKSAFLDIVSYKEEEGAKIRARVDQIEQGRKVTSTSIIKKTVMIKRQ